MKETAGKLQNNINLTTLEITFPKEISTVRSTTGGTWILRSYSEDVSLINTSGRVIKKIQQKPDNPIRNISVSSRTGNLWFCCNVQKSINEIKNESDDIVEHFRIDNLPYSICLTSDDEILVGTELKVSLYSKNGRRLAQTSKDNDDKLHVIQPRNIAVCPKTKNIAVCNRDWPAWGGESKHHVVILNQQLHMMHRYYGNGRFSSKALSASTFDPYDVAYSSDGSLLVADHGNRCIQLVSCDLDVIRNIATHDAIPVTLSLQDNRYLWIGFEDCTIKNVTFNRLENVLQL